MFLEQEPTEFAQTAVQWKQSHRGRFSNPGTSWICLYRQLRFISALQIALLLLVLPQQTRLFRACKINGFFFLTTGWQPDVLSAGEGKKKKRKKEITKSKCKKSQSVSTIRFDGNVKYLLRSSKERKRTGVATWQCVKVYNLAVKGGETVKTEERSQAQRQGWLSKCLKANHNLERCPGVEKQEKKREIQNHGLRKRVKCSGSNLLEVGGRRADLNAGNS